ncbi:MAG: hypothetical protein Q7U16_10430 [Agitococcus sp.]|nr:hypothetical protein [Agitococcus sp.]
MKNIKPILISVYVAIAVLTGIYGSIWGQYDYKGFAYNLGRGLIWPAVMFPSLGKAIGLLIIIGFIAFVTMFGKKA